MKNKSSSFDIDKICNTLQIWFAENHNLKLNIDENFIEQSILDSFEIINFIIFIEKKFHIKFSTDNFSNPEFFTIQGLATLILEKN